MHPPWNYLTHCTRRTDGPWPGQSEESYWDDLLWDRPESDHGPLATLLRIVLSRSMRGSSKAIRGGVPVVCWTEVPGPELPKLRVYRKHRVRWDFCPYGICIERSWLEQQGARPVIYAPPSHWNQLSPQDQPFFQAVHFRRSGPPSTNSGAASSEAATSRAATPGTVNSGTIGLGPVVSQEIEAESQGNSGGIDWRTEREWRTLGDLSLDGLPPDRGFLFVHSEAEAAVMAPASPWPVFTIGELGSFGTTLGPSRQSPPLRSSPLAGTLKNPEI